MRVQKAPCRKKEVNIMPVVGIVDTATGIILKTNMLAAHFEREKDEKEEDK